MIIKGNEENFNDLINKDIVLVDFFANWCGPCRMLSPIIDEIAEDRNDFNIVKVDVDQNPNLAQQYGVMSIPTLMIFKNGKVVDIKNGFIPKEMLVDWINEHK
ncbi:MAG: thioredoxin [Mollicutes bacterium]|nr:thioredoxin [Mollicutes bacterium]